MDITTKEIMTEIIEREPTAEEIAEREAWAAGQFERDLEAVTEQRQQAYQRESDPLNFKWQISGLDEDRAAWLAKREEIKTRYPDPVAPKVAK